MTVVAEGQGFEDVVLVLKPHLPRLAAVVRGEYVCPFRDDEAEFLQLAVDLRRSPLRILVRQASDQNANFNGDSRPPAAWSGSPAPIEAKTSAMPADHSLGFDDDQDIRPATPQGAEGRPEQSVP